MSLLKSHKEGAGVTKEAKYIEIRAHLVGDKYPRGVTLVQPRDTITVPTGLQLYKDPAPPAGHIISNRKDLSVEPPLQGMSYVFLFNNTKDKAMLVEDGDLLGYLVFLPPSD